MVVVVVDTNTFLQENYFASAWDMVSKKSRKSKTYVLIHEKIHNISTVQCRIWCISTEEKDLFLLFVLHGDVQNLRIASNLNLSRLFADEIILNLHTYNLHLQFVL